MLFITYSPPVPLPENVMSASAFTEMPIFQSASIVYSEHAGHPHCHLLISATMRSDNFRRKITKLLPFDVTDYHNLLKVEQVKDELSVKRYMAKNVCEEGGRLVLDNHDISTSLSLLARNNKITILKITQQQMLERCLLHYSILEQMQGSGTLMVTKTSFNQFIRECIEDGINILPHAKYFTDMYKIICTKYSTDTNWVKDNDL